MAVAREIWRRRRGRGERGSFMLVGLKELKNLTGEMVTLERFRVIEMGDDT